MKKQTHSQLPPIHSPACWSASPDLCLWLAGLLPASGVAEWAGLVQSILPDSEPGLPNKKGQVPRSHTKTFCTWSYQSHHHISVFLFCMSTYACKHFDWWNMTEPGFTMWLQRQVILTVGSCINIMSLLQPGWHLVGHSWVRGDGRGGAAHLWLVHWCWAGVLRKLHTHTHKVKKWNQRKENVLPLSAIMGNNVTNYVMVFHSLN